MTLPRSRLAARLLASEARLVRLCGPAGYGKSSLAQLFARRFERQASCDCANVSDVIGFADRALAALAGESRAAADALASARLRLHATEADAATCSRVLLEVWKSRPEHALFSLAHAEAIAENSAVLALLGDLLAARPAERVVLLSSRVVVPLQLARYLAPHQILTLGEAELRCDDETAAGLFEASELSGELVNRIVRLADGRPNVLLLLALIAQYEADVESLIERLDLSGANLHDALANEVLAAFSPEMLATLLATAALPNASLEDIAAATGIRHITPFVERLVRLPGFLSVTDGAYDVHPLLVSLLRARPGVDLGAYSLRVAHEYARSNEALRAAELYAAAGEAAPAAGALERLPATEFQQPSARLIDVLVQVKMSMICAFPQLWIATLPYRRGHVEISRLYDEGLRLAQALAPDVPPALQRRLRVRLATLAQELGRLAEARSLIGTGCAGSPDESPEEQRFVLMTSALIAAKQGRFAEADAFVDEADAVHGARHLRFEGERARIAMEKARLLGDWSAALKMADEGLYAAQRTGVTARIVDAARAVATAAWDGNDDARLTAANQILEDCGDGEVRLFARRVETALSGGMVDAPPRTLQIVRWRAALATADGDVAKELFDRAIEGTDPLEDEVLRIAIRVCAALLLPAQRRRLLEARVIAQSIESPPLQASIELLIDSPEPTDHGMFKPLAARVARSPLKVRQDVLRLEVVSGGVRRGTEVLHTSDRGLELLAALALFPAGTSKEDLAAAMWPGLEGDGSLNTLKMCVSRTRAQVAERTAIRSTKGGYALSDHVVVDIREFERLLRSVRGAEALSEPVRREVAEALRKLAARERAQTAGWAWFAPYAAHLDELARELTLALAKHARFAEPDSWRLSLVQTAEPSAREQAKR